MPSETATTLGVSLLAVFAIALAASGFTGAIEAGPLEDFGIGNDPQTQTPGDAPANGGIIAGQAPRTTLGDSIVCIRHPLFVYGFPLLLLAGAIYLFDRFETWVASRMTAGFGLFFGIPYALLISCPESDAGLAAPSDLGSVFSRAGTDIPTPMPTNRWLLVGAVLLGVIALGVVVHRLSLSGSDEGGRGFSVPLISRPAQPETDLAGVAAAAGGAADRLTGEATVDNEVYRAWREMTAHLNVDRPEASTPGEFEAAAIEAGLAPADVRSLTRVFEAVRYGEADPDVHAAEAAAALRRIEAAAEDVAADHRDS